MTGTSDPIPPLPDPLGDAYQAAWDEWDASGDQALWDRLIGDGPVGGA